MWRYRFRQQQMIDYDAVALILTRYDLIDVTLTSEVLTNDGWEPFNECDMLPLYNVPQIQGRHSFQDRRVQELLDEFEEHVRAVIGDDQ